MDTHLSEPLATPDQIDRFGREISGHPVFSVILCVNRTQAWLAEAIRSVLQQSDQDFEFLIAANACDDALWSELLELVDGDRRVLMIRSDLGQLAYNLNRLADMARGDYLVRMDADDVCEVDRLAALRAELARAPVDILGSAVTLIDESGHVVGRMDLPATADAIKQQLAVRTVFCHPAIAIRRQFLLDMRGYLGGFYSEDTDLWLRAIRMNARMKNLAEPLLRYRVHGNQSISAGRGYAEVAGHWMRELLLSPNWFYLKGLMLAVVKCVFRKRLSGARRYMQDTDQNSSSS